MPEIEISVIIPTYNRADFLKRNLSSIINQKFPKNKYEILICDDGSTDKTRQVVHDLIKKYHQQKIKYFYQKNSGPAACRNLGIKRARGKIIAFTDDDCRPNSDWLIQIENSFRKHGDIFGVGGVTYTQRAKVTPLTCQIENTHEWSFPTCNVAYKKSILEKIGGFDSKFPATNEDADISWRVQKKGKIAHDSKMRVLHPPRKATFTGEIRGVRYLESEFFLLEKMPEEYRKRRVNPYRELFYWYGLRLGAKRIVKGFPWLFKSPLIYLQLTALIMCQRIYLIMLVPGFIYRHHKRKAQSAKPKASV